MRGSERQGDQIPRNVRSETIHRDRLGEAVDAQIDRYSQVELRILREEFWSGKPRTAVKLLSDWGLSNAPQEVGYVVAFDGMRNVRTVVEVARGSHGTLDIHVPSVLRAVLLSGGERFVLVHTHPTGNATPSPADTDTTNVI